ncbi:MAG: ester cyclase [Oceanospirillaceae bacterium]|nr:ester cyclase [Oceanospirillaceae bacterium]
MKNDIQAAKACVVDFYQHLDNAAPDALDGIMRRYTSNDYLWRGYHPFNEQTSVEQVTQLFWQPLRLALTHLQRRQDVFMAGRNEMDGFATIWVVSMGHLMGLFDQPWLGIAATGKLTMLRYCEFNKVQDGKITETAMYFDIPHLMVQAGLQPFALQTAAQLVQPGPMTHTGLMFDEQDVTEGEKTLAAINHMINALGNWEQPLSLQDELRLSWHEDMLWWGPTGIGAAYTIERYAQQHAGPFRAGFKDRIFNGHVCRLAEGEFGGFFGWPNLTLEPTGGFMGMPATGKRGEMRIIDIYRRKADKLAENWIFIDLLHFWKQQGVDILARTTGLSANS